MSATLPPPIYAGWCERFARLFDDEPASVGKGAVFATVFAEVIERYGETHRRYHGVEHVLAVVNRVPEIGRQLWPELSDQSLHHRLTDVLLGAWYHDVIYDPRSHDNEDASAELAIVHLRRCGFPPSRISHIVDLILMTKGHRPRSEEESILADADLWTLGGTPEEYARYGALIREEYSHVPDADWFRGRSAAMRAYLDRPTIFATEYGRANRETQAQANVFADVARMTM